MGIIREKTIVKFKDIDNGTVFMFLDPDYEEKIFMKIYDATQGKTMYADLSNGVAKDLSWVDVDEEEVEVLTATLYVK